MVETPQNRTKSAGCFLDNGPLISIVVPVYNMEKYLEREEILHNSPGEDVVVEAISFPEGIYTSGAGEITSDAEHWINIGVSDYYGVKSVRTE